MCLRVRDVQSEQQRTVQEPPVIRGPRLSRPQRVVGAVAAAVAAAVVVAALVFPSSTTAVAGAERSTVPVPVAIEQTTTTAVPTTAIEQTATTMDDGVPSSTDVARSKGGAGPCHHEL